MNEDKLEKAVKAACAKKGIIATAEQIDKIVKSLIACITAKNPFSPDRR